MGFPRTSRWTIGCGALAIAVVALVTGGISPASAADGPVLYLSRHGAPTDCTVTVTGTLADGSPFSDSLHRQSCDGTLWMPTLRSETGLQVHIKAFQPQDHTLDQDFTVKDARDENNLYVDNMTAVCFLVKSSGSVVYTNLSAKGGNCNGA